MTLPAAEQSCAILHRFPHPLSRANGITFADQRAQVGRIVHWIAKFQLADTGEQQVAKFRECRALYENPLYRNAGLASVTETSRHATLRGPGNISIAVHNDSGIAAELEHHFLFTGAALKVPSHSRAAGETDQLDAVVGDQQPGIFVRERQNVECAVRKPRLFHRLRKEERAEWSLWCRLQNNWAAAGDRRSHFMCDQIQRKVERSNSGNRAKRKTANNPPPPRGELLPIERQILAGNSCGLFGGDIESENGALDFSARGLEWFAGFLS